MVAREGQHSALFTNDSSKLIQSVREETYGIFATDSIVWSSVRMKTMFGRVSAAAPATRPAEGTAPRFTTTARSATPATAVHRDKDVRIRAISLSLGRAECDTGHVAPGGATASLAGGRRGVLTPGGPRRTVPAWPPRQRRCGRSCRPL